MHVEPGDSYSIRQNEASIHKAAKEFSIDRKRVQEWSEKYDELKRHSGGVPGKQRRLTMHDKLREPLSSL